MIWVLGRFYYTQISLRPLSLSLSLLCLFSLFLFCVWVSFIAFLSLLLSFYCCYSLSLLLCVSLYGYESCVSFYPAFLSLLCVSLYGHESCVSFYPTFLSLCIVYLYIALLYISLLCLDCLTLSVSFHCLSLSQNCLSFYLNVFLVYCLHTSYGGECNHQKQVSKLDKKWNFLFENQKIWVSAWYCIRARAQHPRSLSLSLSLTLTFHLPTISSSVSHSRLSIIKY